MKETLYIAVLLVLGTCFQGFEGTDINLLPRYLVAIFILLVGLGLFYKKFRKTNGAQGIALFDFVLFAYCALHFISLAWSQNIAEGVFEAGKSVVLVGGFYLIRNLLSSSEVLETRHLKRINLLITCGLLLLMMYQFSYMMTNYNHPNPYHIKGLSSHKNLLASFLMLLLPLNIVGMLKERGVFKTLFIAFTGLQFTALVLLQSRAVYVGLGLAAIFFVASNFGLLKNGLSKFGKRILLGGAIILVAALGLSYFGGFLDTLKDKTDITQFAESRSAKERVVLWKNSLELIAEKPIHGHGAGNWKIHFPRTGLGDLNRAANYDAFFLRPHNDYISIISELGILGLGLFLFILIAPLVWFFKTKPEFRSVKLVASTAILFGFLAVLFFDFPKERIEHQLYLALLLAIVWIETKDVEKRRLGFSIPKLPLLALGAGIMIWNLFSGYQRYEGDKNMNRIFAMNDHGAWKQMESLAKETTNTFFTVDPISNPVDWFTGMALFQQGKTDEAETYLKLAVKAHPNNHKVLNSLAGVYNRKEDFPKAIAYYQKALDLNPFYENAILNLAITYYQAKDFDQAEEWINKSKKESEQKQKIIEAIKLQRAR